MSTFKGLFDLRLPPDLVRKLRHDLERMATTPLDQYAAFDFFVTAEHIVDWLHPNDRGRREALRESEPLLRITSHLANGSKHFEAKAKHHDSVAGTEKFRYMQEGYYQPGYYQEALLVHLTPKEAGELGEQCIEVRALARQVLEYWSKQFPSAT